MNQVVAIDWETYYGADLSVKLQGPVVYSNLTQIFMVGIFSPGLEYVGPPQDAPWREIAGAHWVAHNAGFDSSVWSAAIRRGIIPDIRPASWDCTADLSAYVGVGRKLEEAVQNSFGETISKSIRDRAGNRHWPNDFNPKMQEDFKTYCLADAQWCYKLWEKWHEAWLPEEREFARLIRMRNFQGIAVDQAKLDQVKSVLQFRVREAREQIPWDEPLLSRKYLNDWCAKQGIEPPKSTAEKNEECTRWLEKYGTQYPVIFWLRNYRKANRRLAVCEAIERRIMPSGRMNFVLKYFGAQNTGRLSGSDGLNMQNLNKDEAGGVDLRSIFVAGPGKIFVIADFAQIEPRVVAWVCKDCALLDQLRLGMNFYEVDARLAGTWDGESGTLKTSNKHLYQLQKAQTLGLGYGMGVERFIESAKIELGLDFTYDQAASIRAAWHRRYPRVKKFWDKLERALAQACMKKEPLILRLPSGRALTYYDLKREQGAITGATTMGSKRRMRYWGGALFENLIQAIARDVLRDAILRLEAVAGYPVIFSSHDEVICEVASPSSKEEIVQLMTIPPTWASDLPLSAEATASRHYLK